jgi:hypothetical protein
MPSANFTWAGKSELAMGENMVQSWKKMGDIPASQV